MIQLKLIDGKKVKGHVKSNKDDQFLITWKDNWIVYEVWASRKCPGQFEQIFDCPIHSYKHTLTPGQIYARKKKAEKRKLFKK